MKIAFKPWADYVATGHYCKKSEIELSGESVYQLLAGADSIKINPTPLSIIARTTG
jgi:tRNA-specific 2-thiouridylase